MSPVAGRRQLSAEESSLWQRVAATVRPFGGRKLKAEVAEPAVAVPSPSHRFAAGPSLSPAGRGEKVAKPGETLDGGWDRRLRQGVVAPDRTIDLHGHTLASAHAALDHALERAIADDVRVLLVVTGRAPRESDRQPRRGLIRAAIGDWLGASRHSGRIAAVRNAHPRHGGAGALYLVLRRRR